MLVPVPVSLPQVAPTSEIVEVATGTPIVPFYSQFKDVALPSWKKRACGIASLAMILDFYTDESSSTDKLLSEGIRAGAYTSAGWTYKGLIGVAEKHGLTGESFDLGKLSSTTALREFQEYLRSGPVIASVHYKMDPKSTIPHLVVINGYADGYFSYNDPAATSSDKKISLANFLAAWKKRFIVLRPA